MSSSIHLRPQVTDLSGSLQKGLDTRSSLDQRAAQQAEMQKKQKMQEAYNSSVVDGKLDRNKYVSQIGQLDGEKAMSLGRDFAKDKDDDLTRQMKMLDTQAQLLGAANDDAGWQSGLKQAQAMGIDTTGLPQNFDPQTKNYLLGRTLKAKEQLDIKFRESEAQRAQANSDRDFAMTQKNFDRAGEQFQQTFGYNKQKDSRDFGYRVTQDDKEYGLAKQKLEQDKADASGITVGRKEVDKQFGKTYEDWTSSGRPAVDKNLERLNNAIALLESDDSLSGPAKALVPDKLRAFTNPKALSVRDDVRAAAQGALKATLGAQFTEKEGERIMNQAYNEALSPAENVKKIKAAIAELQAQRDMNERKSAYFQQRGTLTGFDGTSSGASMAAKNLESLPDDELDALFNQLQGK